MSYLVLARKYRPRNFAEMVGQDHVVRSLTNALTQQRLHHAYLFTGTRGVGKTTVSRIFAKSLNCIGADGRGGITAQPCGQCNACCDIDAGNFVDYIELDAASNRGVEEITRLLDQAVYKPVAGRFKVYMIDEVHMLSTTAFNAMLKTLEEPPEYLKFVLATTDPQKVPVTVLSRCLQFNLRPMATETVVEHLQKVLQDEGIAAQPPALRLLARAARGSMRDGLSLTDQAIAYGAGQVDETQVRHMLGAVDRSHAVRLVEALAAFDGAAVVATVDQLRELGLSAHGALEELVALTQQMAVLQAVPQAVDPDEPDAATLQRLAALVPADETQLLYSLALHGRAELGLAPDEYSAMLMVLLRMLAFKPQDDNPAPRGPATPGPRQEVPRAAAVATAAAPATRDLRRDTSAVRASTDPVVVRAPAALTTPAPASKPSPAPVIATRSVPMPAAPQAVPSVQSPAKAEASTGIAVNAPVEAVASEAAAVPRDAVGTDALTTQWAVVVNQLLERGAIAALARELALQAQCVGIAADATPPRWTLRVERETLRQSTQRDKLEAALRDLLGEPVVLEVQAGPVTDSVARREAAAKAQAQARAEAVIRDHPGVTALLQQFATARIVPGSVRPA